MTEHICYLLLLSFYPNVEVPVQNIAVKAAYCKTPKYLWVDFDQVFVQQK